MDNAEKISDEENSEMDEACFFMVELALLDDISHEWRNFSYETGELHQTLCALLQFLDKSTLPVQVKIIVTCSLVTRLRAILKVYCKKIKFDVSCTCVQWRSFFSRWRTKVIKRMIKLIWLFVPTSLTALLLQRLACVVLSVNVDEWWLHSKNRYNIKRLRNAIISLFFLLYFVSHDIIKTNRSHIPVTRITNVCCMYFLLICEMLVALCFINMQIFSPLFPLNVKSNCNFLKFLSSRQKL